MEVTNNKDIVDSTTGRLTEIVDAGFRSSKDKPDLSASRLVL